MKSSTGWLALLLLLTGCRSGPLPPAAPASPGVPPPRSAQPPLRGETSPQADQRHPSADALRVALDRVVHTVRPAAMRTGRARWNQVITTVPLGTELGYVDSREGWLLVQTAGGSRGWLPGADGVIAVADEPSVRYQVEPGRWRIETASGISLALAGGQAGQMQLTVAGFDGNAEVMELGRGGLALLFPAPGARAALDVGNGGLGSVSLSEHGVLVDLERPAHWVAANGDGRVEIRFGPGLAGVERTDRGYALHLLGEAQPALREEGGNLLVDLPGATLLAPGSLPPGVSVQQLAPEPGAGGVRVRLPATGEPYALYRREEGGVELRFLPPRLAGKVIIVDPGHGGEETGAVSDAGRQEKEINLEVALRLAALLEAGGARVIMTRTGDARVPDPERLAAMVSYAERERADLEARSQVSNVADADLFVSLHANAGPPGDRGIETYWASRNLNATRSRHLAELVQQEVVETLGFPDRGVKQRAFYVILHSDAPAVLAEVGFMTHNTEADRLVAAAGQQAVAEALARAIERFFVQAAPE